MFLIMFLIMLFTQQYLMDWSKFQYELETRKMIYFTCIKKPDDEDKLACACQILELRYGENLKCPPTNGNDLLVKW